MKRVHALLLLLPGCGFDPLPEGSVGTDDGSTSSSTSTTPGSVSSASASSSMSSSTSETQDGSSSTEEGDDSSSTGDDESSSSSGLVQADHALSFEGQQHGVTSALPGLPSSYTVEFWVRTDGELHGTLLSSAGGNPLHGIFCYHATGEWTAYDNVLTFIDYSAPAPGWDYVVDPELDLNEQPGWHHVALTKDSTGLIRMFFDGGLVAERQFSAPFAVVERPLKVGIDGGGLVPLEGAMLDELRISSVIRYDGLYEPQRTFDADGDTLYLWHFDEGQGEQAIDEVGGEVIDLTEPIWIER